MNAQHQPLFPAISIDAWNEELTREKRFEEAVQRRTAEKKMRGELSTLKRIPAAGRLVIEP